MAFKSSFLTFSMSSSVRLSKIKLNCLPGLSALSYSKDILAASRSGASSLNAKLTKSMGYSLGRVRSSSLAISVLSTPPEKSTAILAESFIVLSNTPFIQRVISLTLSTNNFLTVATTPSKLSGDLCRPIFLRSTWRMVLLVQKASPLRRCMAMSELAGI